jgi:hypothetical protein
MLTSIPIRGKCRHLAVKSLIHALAVDVDSKFPIVRLLGTGACSQEFSLLDHFVGGRRRARFNGEVNLVVICDSEAPNIAALPPQWRGLK